MFIKLTKDVVVNTGTTGFVLWQKSDNTTVLRTAFNEFATLNKPLDEVVNLFQTAQQQNLPLLDISGISLTNEQINAIEKKAQKEAKAAEKAARPGLLARVFKFKIKGR